MPEDGRPRYLGALGDLGDGRILIAARQEEFGGCDENSLLGRGLAGQSFDRSGLFFADGRTRESRVCASAIGRFAIALMILSTGPFGFHRLVSPARSPTIRFLVYTVSTASELRGRWVSDETNNRSPNTTQLALDFRSSRGAHEGFELASQSNRPHLCDRD